MESFAKTRTVLVAATSMLFIAGCATQRPYYGADQQYPQSSQPYPQGQQYPPSQTQPQTDRDKLKRGAVIGALAGAVVGAISGDSARSRRERALIGAGVGALAGGAIGNYQDRQEAMMREEMAGTGVDVVRQGDDLVLNMPAAITFGFDSADLNPQFFDVLDRVARVTSDYPQTVLEIAGHTDSVGSDDYNQRLSERRANTVGDYLVGRNMRRDRLIMIGGGEKYPVASNDSEAGRAQNRRVEITVMPIRG